MSGVLGIYGLIVSVVIAQMIAPPSAEGYNVYSLFNGYTHLAAGICCGMSCLAAGGTIGIIGDVGVRCFGLKATNGQRAWVTSYKSNLGDDDVVNDTVTFDSANKLYVGVLIMMIFGEALALYGLIVALILTQRSFFCGE